MTYSTKKRLSTFCLSLALLLCLVGISFSARAQETVSYPRNFDADFLKGSTQLVNGNQTHWSKGDAFPNQTSKSSGCDKLFVRGDRFRVHCIRTAAYPDKEGGYVRSQWVEDARGVIRDGQLEGWYAMSDRTWSDGRNNIQDGLYGKGSEAGSVSGSLSADGVISLLMTKQSERHILNQMKVEEGFTYLTGNWKSYQVHPDARHLSYRATYQFDPSMASKPDPAITAETIQQEMEPPRQELVANDQPDGDDPDRKPVTLSGGNGTIALEDALKQQGIDDEQHPRTDSPTTEPIDQFDAWQQDFKDRGWRYSEKDGVAEFEPQEGARDEKGWVYSEEKGDFLPPPESERDIASIDDQNSGDMTQTRPPRDGDQNENGEVWSDEDGGWIGRNLYQQEKERRATIKRLDDQSHRGQSDDVRTLYDAWQASKKQGKLQPKVFKEVADKKRVLDGRIETLISGETDLHRIRFLRDMQDHLSDIDATDKDGVLGDWNRIVAKQEEDVAFKVDYTMKQFIVETGAMTLDTVLTRGAAMATLHTYNAALKEAGNPEGTTGSILWEGAKEGAYQGTVGFVLNKLAAGALTKAKTMRGAAKTVKGTADDVAVTTGKSNWNSSSDAIRTETQKKLLSKLPANHPARKIGNLNETLGKAGGQFDARKITPHMRLDPTSETYKAGIEALKKNPRYLTDKAKKVSDAVRHDLDLAAREQAVKQLYKDRPDLKGHLTHFENTGSHARKGMTYRGGASDIDFTPKGTATAQGKEAEVLFSRYYDKAVNKVSGGKLTMQDLKAHAYGGDKGAGAFQSKTGLNVKDVMNQTSGRIDKLDPSGKITHSLRGDDVVEVGKPTRLFEKGTTQSLAKKDVVRFRKDLANKFREELPEMATQQEKLIQAAKGYKLSRVIESKAIGGRSLAANRALYQWSKQVKNRIPTMTDRQMKAMTEKFLKGIEEGQ